MKPVLKVLLVLIFQATMTGWFFLRIWENAWLSSKTIGTDVIGWGNITGWAPSCVGGYFSAYLLAKSIDSAAENTEEN